MGKILVTGATGQLGIQVIEQLLQTVESAGLAVLAKDPARFAHLQAQGVEIRKGDYDHYDTLVSAFKGIEKLYFVSSSDIRNRVAQHGKVIGAAVQAKVGHVFYTSYQHKSDGHETSLKFLAEAHLKTEQRIRESGLTYTILEHGLYTDILPMFMGDFVLEAGAIFLPAGEGKASFAARADMAAAGAALLTGTGHENKAYELAGSRSYSFHDIAHILSELSGKEIGYLAPSPEVFTAELIKGGVTAEAVEGVASFCTAIAQGEFDCPNATLEKLLGREPLSVKEFLKAAYNL